MLYVWFDVMEFQRSDVQAAPFRDTGPEFRFYILRQFAVVGHQIVFLLPWSDQNRYFALLSLHVILKFLPLTAAIEQETRRERRSTRVFWYCALTESSMSSTTGQTRNRRHILHRTNAKPETHTTPDKRETGDTYHKQRKKLRWRENRKRCTKTYTSTAAERRWHSHHYPPPPRLPPTRATAEGT